MTTKLNSMDPERIGIKEGTMKEQKISVGGYGIDITVGLKPKRGEGKE